MRKPEQKLWDWLRARMDGHWFHERIENRLQPNAPDLYISHPATGPMWIELKVLPAWPARRGTPIALPHWTPGQRNWMRTHRIWGGKACLLLWVIETDELFFIDTPDWPTITRSQMTERYFNTSRRNCSTDTILDALWGQVV